MPGLPMFGEAKYIIQFVAKPAKLTSTPSGPRDRWHVANLRSNLKRFGNEPSQFFCSQKLAVCSLHAKFKSLIKFSPPSSSSSSSPSILIAQQHLAWSALLPRVVREAASFAPKVLPLALVWNINTLHCLHGPHNGCSFYFRNLELSKHVTGHAIYSYGYQSNHFVDPGV